VARILLGVTGGIAAYKALEFTRLATKAGHAVRVVQTEASTRFVGTASFAGITGAPVLITEWEPDPLRGAFPGDPPPDHAPLSHLELVQTADVLVIAPASANTVAKLAAGIAEWQKLFLEIGERETMISKLRKFLADRSCKAEREAIEIVHRARRRAHDQVTVTRPSSSACRRRR